jgi:hypothetical protein
MEISSQRVWIHYPGERHGDTADPWYAGDHNSYLLQRVPSIALSSVGVADIGHTPDDTVEWMGEQKLGEAAALVRAI